ncbi:MAG TPA: hypothetical protein VKL21_09970 [Candidatus Methanoperedens sp.]|nr:hypothetical protein [Candidatus Methanoperedens sp.]
MKKYQVMNHENGQTNAYVAMKKIYWNNMSDKKIIPVKLTPIIQKAINIASEKHLGQKRKADGLPYIVHPFAVAWLLSNIQI